MERHAPGREAGQQIRKTPPRPNESMANACKSAAHLLPAAGRTVQQRRQSLLHVTTQTSYMTSRIFDLSWPAKAGHPGDALKIEEQFAHHLCGEQVSAGWPAFAGHDSEGDG